MAARLEEQPEVSAKVTVPAPKSPMGYTVAEAAYVLDKSTDTIYQWVAKGWIVSRRFGAKIYIPRKALWDLLDLDEDPRIDLAVGFTEDGDAR